jgi:hypothetical protein
MMRLHALVLLPLLAFAACSDDEKSPAGPGATSDAGVDASSPSTDGGGELADAGGSDASKASKTALEATINGVARSLDRAQFGTEKDDAGAERIYIEAHSGGDPACPDPDGGAGASPARTLIVSTVPRGKPGDTFTKADGIAVTLLDFTGDQIPTDPPFAKASAVKVTLVAVETSSVDLELDATFPEGTVKGRIHAEYCASLSR